MEILAGEQSHLDLLCDDTAYQTCPVSAVGHAMPEVYLCFDCQPGHTMKHKIVYGVEGCAKH